MAAPPPRLPDALEIPEPLIRDWVVLEASTAVTLTKAMVDHLFFAFDKVASGQVAMQACLIAFSNGNTEEANAHLISSQAYGVEASNRVRQFLIEAMVATTRS